ncbi:membrane protein insertion efficiency factor YidD [bacterium]|nr:membrane protein insertion efficiency factor YidD [bacterium]
MNVPAKSRIGGIARNAPRYAAIFLINLYRVSISPLLTAWFGPACRFTPTCSEYARDAIREHGVFAGGWMAAKRLGRCRPAGGFGHDPAPRRPAGA